MSSTTAQVFTEKTNLQNTVEQQAATTEAKKAVVETTTPVEAVQAEKENITATPAVVVEEVVEETKMIEETKEETPTQTEEVLAKRPAPEVTEVAEEKVEEVLEGAAPEKKLKTDEVVVETTEVVQAEEVTPVQTTE